MGLAEQEWSGPGPPCAAFERYMDLYHAAARGRGADPAIGLHLASLLDQAGVENIQADLAPLVFRAPEQKLLSPVTMEHIREAVAAAGLAAHTDVDRLVAEMTAFAQDPRTIMSGAPAFHAWGRRPLA